MKMYSKKIETPKSRILQWIITGMLIPIIIGLLVNFYTWYKTKDKVEVTLKLDSWIMIGSIESSDLPSLKLYLGSEEVKNILKVSWNIINTGNKGIEKFETGPFIEFPNDLDVVYARVAETSPLIKVADKLKISGNKIIVKIHEESYPLSLEIAYKVARAEIISKTLTDQVEIDLTKLLEKMNNIRGELEVMMATKRTLTTAKGNIDTAYNNIDIMEKNIKAILDELTAIMQSNETTGTE